MMVREAKGEDIEEKDDWKKKIKLLEKEAEAIRNGDIEKPKFYKPKDNEQFEKKMSRTIEYLDKYIKE